MGKKEVENGGGGNRNCEMTNIDAIMANDPLKYPEEQRRVVQTNILLDFEDRINDLEARLNRMKEVLENAGILFEDIKSDKRD